MLIGNTSQSFKEYCAGLAFIGFVLWFFTKESPMLVGGIFFAGATVVAQWPLQSLLVALTIIALGLLAWATWKVIVFSLSIIGWAINGVVMLLMSAWTGLLYFSQEALLLAQKHSLKIIVGLLVSAFLIYLCRRSLAKR
jgi:hypothetical protein